MPGGISASQPAWCRAASCRRATTSAGGRPARRGSARRGSTSCCCTPAISWAGPTGQSLVYLPVYVAIVVVVERLIALTAPYLSALWRLLTLAIMAFALVPVMEPRAGNFDLLFSLLAVYGWLAYRQRGSTVWLWLMPLVMVLWANLHGGGVMVYFALALAFAAGVLVDRRRLPAWRWRPFVVSVVLAYLALGINGYGAALYVYPWSTIFSGAQASAIAEWRSPDLASVSFLGLRLLLALGFGIGLARSRMNDAAGAFAVGGMLFLALGGARYLIIAVPLLCVWYVPAMLRGARRYLPSIRLPRLVARFGPDHALMATSGVMLIVGGVIASTALPAGQDAALAARYPQATLGLFDDCGVERVWTDYAWGGWTSYQTGWLIGPYGAADSLGDAKLTTAAAVEAVTTDPGRVFDDLGVDAVLTQSEHPLALWLSADPAWRILGTDEVATAAVRSDISCKPATDGAGLN